MEFYGIDVSTFLFFGGLLWFLSEFLISDNVEPINPDRSEDSEPKFHIYVHIRDYFRIFAIGIIILSIFL